MKKPIQIIWIFSMIMMGLISVCSAAPKQYPTVSIEEITLGGISIGSKQSYVRSVYGEPTEVERSNHSGPFGVTSKWVYGDSFILHFASDGWVYAMETNANNGIKTKSGFAVGQNISRVLNYFGDAVEHNGSYYTVRANFYTSMSFKTDYRGKIISISCATAP